MIILIFILPLGLLGPSEHFVVKLNKVKKPGEVRALLSSYGFESVHQIDALGPFYVVKQKRHQDSTKRSSIKIMQKAKNDPRISWIRKQEWYTREPRQLESPSANLPPLAINDPLFYKQWYLTDLYSGSKNHCLDINVMLPWAKGYDGTGVVVAVLDDGIDYHNSDIADNYDEAASYDFIDYDKDPMPDTSRVSSSHGTKCAGTIAASRNDFCGVGVAYNVSIGGIRMLNLKTTDSIEASALSYQSNYIDIYSCNWGPKDDGVRFGKPGPLTLKALRMGATKGRRSLGSIYVWSSGNGKSYGDDCNADGYVSSIYTIAIGAISNDGTQTSFSESCASMLAVTVSGCQKNSTTCKFITTDTGDKCVESFAGTSSAASIATGIIALMLQSNPLLSWRDVQHLIVETSVITNPTDPDWQRNGVGKWFNPEYGFGRMDANALVERSYHWESVETQKKCRCQTKNGPWSFSQGSSLFFRENVLKCYENGDFVGDIEIEKLEHVQLVITISHICRGRLTIQLISPQGTKSQLLKSRPNDTSSNGIHEWVFTSVHFWGEPPKGLWTVVVTDQVLYDPCEVSKKVKNQTVTKDSPEKPKPKPVDEAENVGGFHKKEINVQPDTKTIKEEFKPNSSMIERIVVEKYRLMNTDKATPSKNFNEFGDIKVIINDNSKNNAPVHEKPNIERRTEEPVQPEDSLDEYEEKLWQQELEDTESKNVKDLEEMNVPRYEYTREINHEHIHQYKKSEKQDLQQLTGAVKLITLVFYGT